MWKSQKNGRKERKVESFAGIIAKLVVASSIVPNFLCFSYQLQSKKRARAPQKNLTTTTKAWLFLDFQPVLFRFFPRGRKNSPP